MKTKLIKKDLDKAIEAYEKLSHDDSERGCARFFAAAEKLSRSAVGGEIYRRFLDSVCNTVAVFDKERKNGIPKEKVYRILEVFGYEIVEEEK